MIIKATENVKAIPSELEDLIYEEFQCYCDEDFPMPWDAGIEVENGKIVISGSIAPGGVISGSHAEVTLTPDAFNKYLRFESYDNETLNAQQIKALNEAGWTVE